ncbi:hypothetical protein OHU34_02370 [Streptomyces sp. NBC_00080]|uniref:hypothetical protein n=1 Tax=Streptomyces sp. NBC_00080 TaxID=2975645 RepID=UPI003252E171
MTRHVSRCRASIKIRTIPGPAIMPKPQRAVFALVSDPLALYQQQTKNLLVRYSPTKPSFFQAGQVSGVRCQVSGAR